MKILYTFPTITSVHGGARIVFAHLEGLQKLGHDVSLFVENGKTECGWYDLSGITITSDRSSIHDADIIVIGSPHSIWIEDQVKPHQKVFLFMQMVEELFRPADWKWKQLCYKFYKSRFPIIHGSKWGEKHVRAIGRTGPMHYIGNGVNFDHFPISNKPKDGKTILLESPFSKNPAKDVDMLAYKVAKKLKGEGYKVLAYGANEPVFTDLEYYIRPDLTTMNQLYEESTILVKATKFDARSLSPVEGMTKGCVPIRAIINGDDDLIDCHNCLRSGYNLHDLERNARWILSDEIGRNSMAESCRIYVQEHCNWDWIIEDLNKILTI